MYHNPPSYFTYTVCTVVSARGISTFSGLPKVLVSIHMKRSNEHGSEQDERDLLLLPGFSPVYHACPTVLFLQAIYFKIIISSALAGSPFWWWLPSAPFLYVNCECEFVWEPFLYANCALISPLLLFFAGHPFFPDFSARIRHFLCLNECLYFRLVMCYSSQLSFLLVFVCRLQLFWLFRSTFSLVATPWSLCCSVSCPLSRFAARSPVLSFSLPPPLYPTPLPSRAYGRSSLALICLVLGPDYTSSMFQRFGLTLIICATALVCFFYGPLSLFVRPMLCKLRVCWV